MTGGKLREGKETGEGGRGRKLKTKERKKKKSGDKCEREISFR